MSRDRQWNGWNARNRGRMALVALAGAALGVGGCETDSFLFDPSVTGRWEHTPTRIPILDRIASIEGPSEDVLNFSDPTEADLVPELMEYRIGPGDFLTVTIYDLPEDGRTIDYQREVDPRGFIELPQLGQIYISGMTAAGAEETIRERMKAWVAVPINAVLVISRHAERYSILGAVEEPGQYRIPTSNFRLLEALSTGGVFSEAPTYVYVIRQVPLTEGAKGKPGPEVKSPTGEGGEKPSGEQLIDTINRLNQPEGAKPAAPKPEAPKPEAPKSDPKLEDLPPPVNPRATPAPVPPKTGSPGMFQPEAKPPEPRKELIGLPPGQGGPQPAVAPAAQPESGEMAWIFIDGKWVKVRRPATAGQGPSPLGRPSPGDMVVTQRVIRVPMARLVAGDASVNVVIRSGDVIRVPPNPPGTIYLMGQISRPGAYGVPERGTLTRVLAAAGWINSVGIPERVDLTRMVGDNRQATIRVNLRAIMEGTHPDIAMKSDDLVNIGSNFWAYPMAVIRNGFRVTYGFGFVADRNFADDLYGTQ